MYVLYAGLTGFEGGKGHDRIVVRRGSARKVRRAAPRSASALISRRRSICGEIDLARAIAAAARRLNAVLPDLLLDEELPLQPARRDRDAAGR